MSLGGQHMVDTVKTRRTHYEVLGLKPNATSDEIERAFAREVGIFRPHGVGAVAEAAIAFRTLRDPAKRRAYDASIGLAAEPAPRPSTLTWTTGTQFLTASATPAMQRPAVRPVVPGPQVDPEPRADTPAAPATRPFVAAALRELARPEPLIDAPRTSEPEAESPAGPQTWPGFERPAAVDRVVLSDPDERAGEAGEGAISWQRTAIAAGALVLTVGLLGAWAGWGAGDAAPKPAVKLALPPPTTFTVADPAPAAEAPAALVEDVQPQPTRRVRAAPRVERPRQESRLAELERQVAALPQGEPTAPQAAAADQTTEAAPATVVAASMPLPNRVVARTIERIGYPCGQVSSTTSGGAPGVFTVTCTSGHSYQAAPVHGRYRFRRLGGR
jgi:hypothetical protein